MSNKHNARAPPRPRNNACNTDDDGPTMAVDQDIIVPVNAGMNPNSKVGLEGISDTDQQGILAKFTILGTLGEGTYGVVYKARNLTENKVSPHPPFCRNCFFKTAGAPSTETHFYYYRLWLSKKLRSNTPTKASPAPP